MPGTVVRDALEANLLTGATLNAAGTTNGTAVEVLWPGDVQFYLTTATVTGSSPTMTVLIQGADDSGFTTNVVDIGAFDAVGDEDNAVKQLGSLFVDKRYVRARVALAGTSPVYTGSTVTMVPPHDRRVRATSTA
jgi:alpha-D-ribose 1-methylphosphonate 5-phosphate C-P lyase